MNLREIVGVGETVLPDQLTPLHQPAGRVPGPWLACYPFFQDELRCGETTFGALPESARQLALSRTTIDVAEQAAASNILDRVCVSFIELPTHSVDEIVQSYLGNQEANGHARGDHHTTLRESLAPQSRMTDYPGIARGPCLLRPGRHIFLDGWMRFLSYRSRGDRTIPLLAIDWLDFHHRLSGLLQDAARTTTMPTAASPSFN